MMRIHAGLLSIPDEVLEAAAMAGVTGAAQFSTIRLPLILPTIGNVSILTFVGNFIAFDLMYLHADPHGLVTVRLFGEHAAEVDERAFHFGADGQPLTA